ncbi:MAG: hypothetical protein WCG03_09210, partial [Kiritimatiellales bacterium]
MKATRLLVIGCWLLGTFFSVEAVSAENTPVSSVGMPPQSSLEETRLKMNKWIETQQIISKESKDWQQGKNILNGRLELVNKEIATLTEKNKLAETSLAETGKKRGELLTEADQLKATGAQLAEKITGVEADIRRIYKQLPEPIQTKLQPLYQ